METLKVPQGVDSRNEKKTSGSGKWYFSNRSISLIFLSHHLDAIVRLTKGDIQTTVKLLIRIAIQVYGKEKTDVGNQHANQDNVTAQEKKTEQGGRLSKTKEEIADDTIRTSRTIQLIHPSNSGKC